MTSIKEFQTSTARRFAGKFDHAPHRWFFFSPLTESEVGSMAVDTGRDEGWAIAEICAQKAGKR